MATDEVILERARHHLKRRLVLVILATAAGATAGVGAAALIASRNHPGRSSSSKVWLFIVIAVAIAVCVQAVAVAVIWRRQLRLGSDVALLASDPKRTRRAVRALLKGRPVPQEDVPLIRACLRRSSRYRPLAGLYLSVAVYVIGTAVVEDHGRLAESVRVSTGVVALCLAGYLFVYPARIRSKAAQQGVTEQSDRVER